MAGFDDIPLARHLGLTTVRVRIAELGERAARSADLDPRRRGGSRRAGTAQARTRHPFNHRSEEPVHVDLISTVASFSKVRRCLSAGSCAPGCRDRVSPGLRRSLPAFYEDIEQRTFRFFWETVNREERAGPGPLADSPSFCSIAAVGFALPAYAIGVERGWCTRAEARDLTLTTLRFFWNAPQGPGPYAARAATRASSTTSSTWRPGFGHRDVELSSVDTTILLLGVLFAGQYYNRDDAAEQEIRQAGRCASTLAPTGTSSASDGRRRNLDGLASRRTA